MKKARELALYKQIKEIREFEFGVIYFFKNGIIISEINEGVIFKSDDARKVVSAAKEIYPNFTEVIYISNRVNKYYVLPFDWVKLYQRRKEMTHYAMVGQSKGSYLSLLLQQLFFSKTIVKFKNIDDAVDWALNISISKLEPVSI